MTLLGRAALLVLLVLGPSAGAAAEPFRFAPDATGFTLDNGLEVVVIPDHRAPVVSHMVWYKVGASDEQPGKSGIAHFLEHLMFKGTREHPAGEFSERINQIGGNENAFTTDDVTVYHQKVAKQHLRMLMEYEADRMANLVLTDAVVLPEREVILEERSQRVESSPGAMLGEAVAAALYQNSRYGIPTIGWEHEMAGLTREDAVAFYDRYYTPNNAIVVIAGDVTEAEARALAEETYGKVARRAEIPPRVHPREPEPVAGRTVTLADPRVTQPSFQRVYLVPSYVTGAPGEADALDVLGEILGGGSSSRLYKTLVIDQGIAVSAGAGYRGTAFEDTQFVLYGVPRGDVSLEALAAAMDGIIADIAANGITGEELARAKKRILANAVYSQDNAGRLGRVFGNALAVGKTIADVQNWPADIEAVTADAVTAAARKYLVARRSVTGYLIGAPAEGRS